MENKICCLPVDPFVSFEASPLLVLLADTMIDVGFVVGAFVPLVMVWMYVLITVYSKIVSTILSR